LELLRIATLRTFLKSHGITELALQGKYLKIAPVKITESLQMRVQRLYPGSIVKSATSVLMVARPKQAAWEISGVSDEEKIGDTSLLDWVIEVVETILRSAGHSDKER